jgi:hypothetical protein
MMVTMMELWLGLLVLPIVRSAENSVPMGFYPNANFS